MKRVTELWIIQVLLCGSSLILLNSCAKDDNVDWQTVADVESNIYKVVKLGAQTWMAENLKTTSYNDGTPIPNVSLGTEWNTLTTGAYSNYDNSEKNVVIYGRLYNWYAVKTGNLCPKGWHVPTEADWTALKAFLMLYGYSYDGSATGTQVAKSLASTIGWAFSDIPGAIGNAPETNNRSGFTGLPGGIRYGDGTFINIGNRGYWWSATESPESEDRGIGPHMSFDGSRLGSGHILKACGISVRCIRIQNVRK